MDIVVSIDNNMDFATLQQTAKNFGNMLNMFYRQSVNYQLYLTDGTEVSSKDLGAFVNNLYAEKAKLEIANSGAKTVTELQEYVNIYPNGGKIITMIEDEVF